MHQKFKALISTILLILVFGLSAGCSKAFPPAKNYSVSQYDIQVALQPDGSADVAETITFRLDQGRQDFNFDINYTAAGSIKFGKISIAEDTGGKADFVDVQASDFSSNAQATSFKQTDDGRELQILLHAVSEANTKRVVRLTYHLVQAVTCHQDAALLRYNFFSSCEDAAISQPSLTIKLPEAIPDLQTWYLPVSRASFDSSRPGDDQLAFKADEIPAGQDLLLYCLLPPQAFADAKVEAAGQTWDGLTTEARSLDAKLQRKLTLDNSLNSLIFILLGLAVVLIFLIFWLFDKESAAQFRQRYTQEIPDQTPPAVLALLMHKLKPGKLILATLLDLTRRGDLALNGCVFTQIRPERQDYSGFTAFEIFLLQWLFGRIAGGATISTADIRRYACDTKTADDFRIYYQQFLQLLDEEVDRRKLTDRRRSRHGKMVSWAFGAFYLAAAVAITIYLQNAAGLLLLIPAAILAIYSLQIRRLTLAGQELYAISQALYRTMRHWSKIKPLPPAEFFPNVLPLAVSLGAGESMLNQLLTCQDQPILTGGAFAVYGIGKLAQTLQEQVRSLEADLKVMESMLSSSFLMSSGIQW